jgi:hypothetical protein
MLASVSTAAVIPEGTVLSVRQRVAVGTRFSKVGDPVSAVLLGSISTQDRTILPAGSGLYGRVTMVRKVGLGFKHQTASLALDFDSIRLTEGKVLSIDARMKRVENAREWVDPGGRIHGIGPVTNVSSTLAVGAWRLLAIAPGVGVPVWATKLLFAPAPDTEITFAAGTEYRLELTRDLRVDESDLSDSGLPTHLLHRDIRTQAEAILGALSSQHAQRVSGGPADLVNLIFLGSADGVTRAFQAAGWSTADPQAARSAIQSYFSIMQRTGYRTAPMATMFLNGNRSDIELQKNLDSFAKRHHLRIWARPDTTPGENVWVAAATEDIGIKFSKHTRTFTHAIDGNVDTERTKVMDDLLYTGCVSDAGLIGRNDLPAYMENGTGTRLKTDGRVAVIRLGECTQPRVMPGVEGPARTSVLRALATSLRTELIRSNFISLAFDGLLLTSYTRTFLFRGPSRDDTGTALTRQQVEWLGEKEPAERASVPQEAPEP